MNLDELNPAQREAVEYGDGPLLILAGAGSGKTRVITHRLARLIERGVRPWRMLAVTFTNKAAAEMRERTTKLVGAEEAKKLWIGTFHATCAKLLRLNPEAAGLTRDFNIYDDDDQRKLVSMIMKEQGYAQQITPRGVLSKIDQAKNEGIRAEEYAGDDYVGDIVAKVYAIYQQRLRAANAVDFGDLLLNVLRLTDDSEVGPRLRGRFEHVLVDEFQDTNRVQFELVRRLAATGNLAVVGDDDQSIYSWRGADVRNIVDFERHQPGCHTVKLEQNYRSTQHILDAANAVIARNVYRKRKRLFTEEGPGEKIVYHLAPDERREAADVVRAILTLTEEENRELRDVAILYRMNSQSRALEEALRAEGMPYTVYGSTRFFDRAEIKDLLGWLRVVANPADEISLLRIVNSPPRGIGDVTMEKVSAIARARGVTLWEAMRMAAGGAGAARARAEGRAGARGGAAGEARATEDHGTLALFGDALMAPPPAAEPDPYGESREPGEPFGAALFERVIDNVTQLGAGPKKKLAAFVHLVNTLRERADATLSQLAELVLHQSGLVEHLQAERTPESEDRLENLEELLGSIRDFEGEAEDPTLTGYLERVSLVSGADTTGGGVSLMTVHAAKGLEFPVVFLCGLEDGTFPLVRDEEDAPQQLEEERRLCYVAITRARERLILTGAEHRRLFRGNAGGDASDRRPSRFLVDIPPHCLMRQGTRRTPTGQARIEPRHDGSYVERERSDDEGPPPRSSRRAAMRDGDSYEHRDARDTGRRPPDAGIDRRAAESAWFDSDASAAPRVEYEPSPERAGAFRVGQRVSHSKFGEGRVRALSGSGDHLKLDVEFPDRSMTIVARFVQPL